MKISHADFNCILKNLLYGRIIFLLSNIDTDAIDFIRCTKQSTYFSAKFPLRKRITSSFRIEKYSSSSHHNQICVYYEPQKTQEISYIFQWMFFDAHRKIRMIVNIFLGKKWIFRIVTTNIKNSF